MKNPPNFITENKLLEINETALVSREKKDQNWWSDSGHVSVPAYSAAALM